MIHGIELVKILFIWVKNELKKNHLLCMDRARKIYPDACFKLITDQYPPFHWIEKVEPYKKKFKTPQLYSDWARIKYLSENPYTLYIDTDVYCLKPIPLEKPGSDGIWAIYNHNIISLMKNILSQIEAKEGPFYYGNILKFNFAPINKYFAHREKEFKKHINNFV